MDTVTPSPSQVRASVQLSTLTGRAGILSNKVVLPNIGLDDDDEGDDIFIPGFEMLRGPGGPDRSTGPLYPSGPMGHGDEGIPLALGESIQPGGSSSLVRGPDSPPAMGAAPVVVTSFSPSHLLGQQHGQDNSAAQVMPRSPEPQCQIFGSTLVDFRYFKKEDIRPLWCCMESCI